MKKLSLFFSAVMLCLTLTACGSGEPAKASSVAESDKSIVQEKLNKTESKSEQPDETAPAETADSPDSPETDSGTNILVAYFSRADENYSVGTVEVGNTQILAEYIAGEVGADSFHIETVTPYPADYDECCDVAKQEQKDNARPEIIGSVENTEQYDIVFLGYPIWWGDMPMAVYTFMDSYDWTDKVVIPFCTHEGSGLSGTDSSIASVTGAQVLTAIDMRGSTAQALNDDTRQTVRSWLDDLGF
ncbi:Flavodoxin [Ruminococcus sp. YE71]|uniref:flavodoxin n=1 Tax=unclassified Ruminococcus TaxID=2608920 RepID=UPI000887DC0D|nr:MULTISPECIES: flavodoxin [unclassified Ruminococcus]SDA25916.1 Flavodoxin [Ruminococcus sp. YE78]SFW35592.1 Flavodoxin [Ruminococcus sp. YE71]